MGEKQKRCCCDVKQCPCYPNCDDMMANKWKPVNITTIDREPTLLMKQVKADEEDLKKLKSLYPDMVKRILEIVEQVCDSMEYEGSMMFDEMPDKERIRKLIDGIQKKADESMEQWVEEEEKSAEDLYVMNQPVPPYPPPMPPCEGGCRGRENRWYRHLIQVLLEQEMYHRRCRNRSCRKW